MWNQTTSTVEITVELPANTRGRDVRVTVDDGALTVWTSWHGVVEGLSGALARRVKADETAWSVASDALEIVLAKDADRDGDPWGCVFADARLGCAKSPREVLKDMVFADEPFDSADDFSLESRALLGEMRQRHAALVRGAVASEQLQTRLAPDRAAPALTVSAAAKSPHPRQPAEEGCTQEEGRAQGMAPRRAARNAGRAPYFSNCSGA